MSSLDYCSLGSFYAGMKPHRSWKWSESTALSVRRRTELYLSAGTEGEVMAVARASDLAVCTLSKVPGGIMRQPSPKTLWGAQARPCVPTVPAVRLPVHPAVPTGRIGVWQDAAVLRTAAAQCIPRSRRRMPLRSTADGGAEASVAEALSPEEQEDRGHVKEIQRVLELLRKKRDMTPNEVRLTIMIEDPREAERRKQLGVEDERGCSREDLGNALNEVIQGKVPADRLVLRELAKEMLAWPNLEDELPADESPGLSPYARVTNTGVDPKVAAARRAQADWDAAAEIGPGEESVTVKVPPAVGFSVLYLVSSIPIVIGITVVVVLFLNSLQ